MKIVFGCDLHGRMNLYEELFAYALTAGGDAVLIGGDLFPTRLASPLDLLSGKVDFSEALTAQLEFIDSYLVPRMRGFMEAHPDIRLLYVPGNHDWVVAVEHFMQCLPGALCLHNQVLCLDGITFMGYGCVTDSPFWVKDYARRDTKDSGFVSSRYPLVSSPGGIILSRDGRYALDNPSIEEDLAGLPLSHPRSTICLFHCPPYGTGLDTLHDGKPIGSRSIARYIRQHQPRVSLHGHIHESPYMSGTYRARLGETLAVNPGHHPSRLHAVTFESSDPSATLTHRVFGTSSPTDSGLDRAVDRYARRIKAFFMKTVLMKK